MTRRESADVVVIGGGPAGCAAALRLVAMGRRVAIVERHEACRPRCVESLSPGIGNLLDYLGLAEVLKDSACARDVPARVVWERRPAEVLPPRGSIVVDRADFNARLLSCVRKTGAIVFCPARLRRLDGGPGAWRLRLTCRDGAVELGSRLVLDSRGRSAAARSRTPTGPATVALSAHVRASVLPTETRLEATERAWLWGAPSPDGGYRVVAFVEPAELKLRGATECFRALLGSSTLFAGAADFIPPVRVCVATPHLDTESWRPGVLKTGEAALALDPLSSSGVEKSMRLALQAAVAANTLLLDPAAADVARDFYESSLVASAATHAVWTRDHYGRAWPGDGSSFWRDRSRAPDAAADVEPDIITRLRVACAERHRQSNQRASVADTQHDAEPLGGLSGAAVRLSAKLQFVSAPCVIGDRVESRQAIKHPALDRPVAFLADVDLAPLLRLVPLAQNLGHLLVLWSSHVPLAVAARIVDWVRFHGLLETGTPETSRSHLAPVGGRRTRG